jgi:GrpB-like predicted nucleotidyltransferase (UPF0157 family)
MSNLAFILMAVAVLPFFLLPAFAAVKNRKRSALAFAIGNLLLALWVLYGVRTWFSDAPGFAVPRIGALPSLIIWLVLLHFAMKRDPPSLEDLDEVVELKAYDPSWPVSFAKERQRIADTLSLPEGSVEHIGSTAVPGLESRPVIDLMLGTPGFPPPRDLLSRLAILGYENMGEAGAPGRIHLRLREDTSFNLYVMARDGEHWTNNLALRELLRRDPDARLRYAAEKQRALQTAGNRLLAYSAARSAALADLLVAARKP